jgi:hypothetical protein
MWFEKLVVILITALFIGGMFAFMPGPTWARILVATIFRSRDRDDRFHPAAAGAW